MTVTSVTSAQSFGTSTNVGPFLAPTKTTIQVTTTKVMISAIVTLVAGSFTKSSKLRVRYAYSATNHASAAAGAYALAGTSRYLDIDLDPGQLPTLDIERVSLPIDTVSVGYIFTWLEAPTLGAACTVTVKLLESP